MKHGKVIEMYTTNTIYYAIKLSQKKTVDDLFQNNHTIIIVPIFKAIPLHFVLTKYTSRHRLRRRL